MKTAAILHHSADRSPGPQFLAIDRAHQARGFPKSSLGFFVGYQWVIEKSGKLMQGRTEQETGAHTLGTRPGYLSLNQTGIGICLAGDFTVEDPTPEQILSLAELVRDIKARHPIREVLMHREVKATACPGQDLRFMAEHPKSTVVYLKIKRLTREAKPGFQRVIDRLLWRS